MAVLLTPDSYCLASERISIRHQGTKPDVFNKVQGAGKATLHSLEGFLAFGRIAAQCQDVLYANLLQLRQHNAVNLRGTLCEWWTLETVEAALVLLLCWNQGRDWYLAEGVV